MISTKNQQLGWCARAKHSCLESANKLLYIPPRGATGASFPLKTSCLEEGSVMKLRPLHDRVVVRRIEEDERTPGGSISPDTAK